MAQNADLSANLPRWVRKGFAREASPRVVAGHRGRAGDPVGEHRFPKGPPAGRLNAAGGRARFFVHRPASAWILGDAGH